MKKMLARIVICAMIAVAPMTTPFMVQPAMAVDVCQEEVLNALNYGQQDPAVDCVVAIPVDTIQNNVDATEKCHGGGRCCAHAHNPDPVACAPEPCPFPPCLGENAESTSTEE